MSLTPRFSDSRNPLHALKAALRLTPATAGSKPRLMVAGATGVLGNEVLRRLVGSGRYAHTEVLAIEAMASGMSGVGIVVAGDGLLIEAWDARPERVHTGLVMFEPPRLFYGRERTLWTPVPEQLPALARWLKRCGVQTLVVVVPHASGRLPDALKRGLADLDEQAVVSLGFERVLLVRSARKAESVGGASFFEKTASWMLSTLKYMIPATEQAVRPARLAEFIDAALQVLPPGIHVVAPELLWQANLSGGNGMQSVVRSWLAARENPEQNSTPHAKPD